MASPKGTTTFNLNSNTQEILEAALEFLELKSQGRLNHTNQREFMSNKGLAKTNEAVYSKAIIAANSEWQKAASEFREYGTKRNFGNTEYVETVFRMALSIYDMKATGQRKFFAPPPPRSTDERGKQVLASADSNRAAEEQTGGDDQQHDEELQHKTAALTAPSASQTPLPDLTEMAASMISVANGLNAYKAQFDRTANLLDEECGKRKRLSQQSCQHKKVITSLKETNTSLQARVDDLSKAIDEGRNERESNLDKVSTLCEEKKELELENHRLTNELYQRDEEIEKTDRKRKRLKSENTQLKEQEVQQEEAMTVLKETNARLEARIDNLSKAIDEGRKEKEANVEQVSTLQEEKKQLESENQRLTKELSQRTKDLEKFEVKRKRLKSENAQLREQVAGHDQTYDAFVDVAKHAAILDSKQSIRRQSFMDDYITLKKQYEMLDFKYRQATENLSFQTSEYQKERQKRLSLADQVTQLTSLLEQEQKQEPRSARSSPPKDEPREDCYDIDI